MVQSVELLLDDALDAAVRTEWAALLDAGLPSQARHTGASNAPHVTLGICSSMPDSFDAVLTRLLSPLLPLPIILGPLTLFPGKRLVLVRLVVPSADLLALQAAVASTLSGLPGSDAPHLTPDTWTPHVTLARHLSPDQLPLALTALGPLPDLTGSAPVARHWNSDTRQVQDLCDDHALPPGERR